MNSTTHANLPLGKGPTKIEEADQIIDLYYFENATQGATKPIGGKGAYCYVGTPFRCDLRGTELEDWVDDLAARINRQFPTEDEFRIEFEGRAFRGCRDRSGTTSEVALRRLPNDVPTLDQMEWDNQLVPKLLTASWLNQGGLVILSGLTGQAKTTIASATVRTRLEAWGGRAVTTEEPPEFPLDGLWGSGSCRQLAVGPSILGDQRSGFAGAIRLAYRKLPATRPAILFVGEVRDAETAAELIKASINGMLVICTSHAMDPMAAVRRIVSLAKRELEDAAAQLMAQGLRLVVQNRLTIKAAETGWKRGSNQATILVSDGDGHPVATLVRESKFQQLATIFAHQQTCLRIAKEKELAASDLINMVGSKAPEYQNFSGGAR